MMPKYWIIDQSAADEIGSHRGQSYEEVVATLDELLKDDKEALDNLIVIRGQSVHQLVKTVVSFEEPKQQT